MNTMSLERIKTDQMGDFFDLYGFVQNNLIKSVKFLDHQRKTFKNKKKF